MALFGGVYGSFDNPYADESTTLVTRRSMDPNAGNKSGQRPGCAYLDVQRETR